MKLHRAFFIIWSSSKKNFENIIIDISKYINVKERKIIEIEKYYEFICDVYTFNNQRDLGFYKANIMCSEDKYVICIVEVEFLTENSNDYTLIKKIKAKIRNDYKKLTKDYFHDNIIHGTDSVAEYNYIKKIVAQIEKYRIVAH